MLGAPANERLLLGSILLLGDIPAKVARFTVAVSFSDPCCAVVYEAMCAILRRSEALDVSTIEAELEGTGRLELVGGLSGLCDIVRSGGTHTIEHYAAVVVDAAGRRLVHQAARELTEACHGTESLAAPMLALKDAYHAWRESTWKAST